MATNPKPALTPEEELARRTRRSFIALGAGAAAAAGGWYWLNAEPMADEIPRTLRACSWFQRTRGPRRALQ